MKVALVVNALGIGGTEKAVQTHALAFDRERVDVRVVAIHEGGPRRAVLERAGIEVECAEGRRQRLAELLAGVDLVHVTRAGVAEPLLPAACRAAGIGLLVETNVFGAVDASRDEADFSMHLLPSKMCALRYRRRLDLAGAAFHARHRVSHWPVDIEALRDLAPDPAEAKARLGLDPDRPAVVRVGRAADPKWRNLVVDMVPPLLRLVPEVQVAYVGATPAKLRRLDRLEVLDRVRLFPTTSSEEELACFYAAADVFVTAAEIGESHSFAIEEAMCLGAPVVTCSTPWVDNAQIEQVDEGETGHIADHPQPFAEAVSSLLLDERRRRRYGERARAKADALFDARLLTRQLEGLYEALLAGEPPAEDWTPPPAEVDDFASEYERRLAASYRPLDPTERRQADRERRQERARWALRAARTHLDLDGARYAAGVVRARMPGGAS